MLQQFSTSDFVQNVLGTSPTSNGKGGAIRPFFVKRMPALRNQGVSFAHYVLEPCGMNSPQMHPRATEMNFVINGTQLEMGFIEENGGSVVVNQLKSGFMGFIPKAYIHWHLNRACEPAEFVAMWNDEDPGVTTIANALFIEMAQATDALETALRMDAAAVDDIASRINQFPNPLEGVKECLQRCGIAN